MELETLPVFKRLELEGGEWVSRYWLPNLGSTRDLPSTATLHPSVLHRVKTNATYNPKNLGFAEALNQASVENGGS